MVNKCTKIVQSWFYPAVCALCGATGDDGLDLCAACRGDLPYNTVACSRCALPLTGSVASDALCGHCLRHPPAYQRTLAPFRYAPPLDYLLQRLKFNGKLIHARLLGTLMAEYLAQRLSLLPERIIPVPLHRARLSECGFNQALELARPIARRLGVALDHTICERLRATAAQSRLPAAQRRANVRNAFRVRGAITARHVAIVDDVVTTGNTVNELARALRKAGVQTVEIWACGRAG
ncbi:MAG: ComF family protein [Gammaproteobacteria bacterium]|nr:ComF family protein [Gammaproteobacteria bacterium]